MELKFQKVLRAKIKIEIGDNFIDLFVGFERVVSSYYRKRTRKGIKQLLDSAQIFIFPFFIDF